MRIFLIILVGIFSLYGCKGEMNADAITKGASYTQDQKKLMENIDRNSYIEVADVFKETNKIQGEGKPYLLVFAANGCVYCDRLKDIIKKHEDIKEDLRANYAPYYINISYAKTHFVAFLDAEVQTADLARKYEIIPTPTLIFLSANGKELFVYPGFMPQQKFQKALDFFKNPDLESMESQAIKQSFQNFLES